MKSYIVWTEGGGHGKTTLSVGLSQAHKRAGNNVLVVDMDGQKGGLTAHYGLRSEDKTENGNSIVEFLADTADEDIRNLIRTKNGVDIIPSSGRLRDLDEAIYKLGGPRQKEVPDEQLRRIIGEDYGLHKDYDVLVIDAPKDIGMATKNGLFAARNILMPLEVDEKGKLSLDGIVENLVSYRQAKALDDFGVVSLVLNKVDDQLNLTESVRGEIRDRLTVYEEQAGMKIPVCPIEFEEARSLFKEAFRAHTDPFKYYFEEKDRQYETDRRALHKLDLLGEYVIYHLAGTEGRIPSREEIDYVPTTEELAEKESTGENTVDEPAPA